jgi:hypothetical protein
VRSSVFGRVSQYASSVANGPRRRLAKPATAEPEPEPAADPVSDADAEPEPEPDAELEPDGEPEPVAAGFEPPPLQLAAARQSNNTDRNTFASYTAEQRELLVAHVFGAYV